jgi:hypothetical protein
MANFKNIKTFTPSGNAIVMNDRYDEYPRMQIAEVGRRVEEFKEQQQIMMKIIEELSNQVTEYKRRQEAFKKDLDDDTILYGNKVWTKSTNAGPFVTINRVALKIKTDKHTRTVMGWICKDNKGNHVELAEEDLSKNRSSKIVQPIFDFDWLVLIIPFVLLSTICLSILGICALLAY